MNNDIEKIIKIGISVIALLVVVSLGKLTPKDEAVTLDDYTPDITTENTTTEHAIGIQENTIDYTTEDVQENNLIVPEGREDEFFADEITIPRNITVGEDGTVTVIEPFSLNYYFYGTGTDQREEKIEQLHNRGIELVSLYENDDKTWEVTYDSKNLEQQYLSLEKYFNYEVQNTYSKISVSTDFDEMIFYMEDDSTVFELGFDILIMKWWSSAAQVYSGVPYDEWTLHLEVVYEETGELMYEFDFSEEDYEYNITEEEWNQKLEEMKENATATDATY